MKPCIFVIFVIFVMTQPINSELSIKNLNNDPILLLKLRDCKLQKGITRIIHQVDMASMEKIINDLTSLAHSPLIEKSDLHQLVEYKIIQLHNNFEQIRPTTHRRKRWDKLGTIWKFLAGTPDADDLKAINSSLNNLVEQNNQQVIINDGINNQLQILTQAVNKVLTEMDTTQNDAEATKLILNINSINEILLNIQNAILGIKIALPNNKLLSMDEITLVKDILNKQGIQTDTLEEALNYVIPKMATDGNTLVYMIQVPLVYQENAVVTSVTALTNNKKKIVHYPRHLIQYQGKLFTTQTPNQFIQRFGDIQEFNDSCIYPLLRGMNSSCNVIMNNEVTIQALTENQILIDNGKQTKLSSDCRPDNFTLNGNFLVSFDNCTVQINGESFKSTTTTVKTEEIQGFFYNTMMQEKLIESYDLEKIKNETMKNRKTLQTINLKHFTHQAWLWTLTGFLMTSLTIPIVMMLMKTKIMTLIKKKDDKTSTQQQSQPMQELIASLTYKNLLKKDSTEDSRSTPPGGVTQ